jgi:hypothetical protein
MTRPPSVWDTMLEHIATVISHRFMGSPHLGILFMARVIRGICICCAYILVYSQCNMFYKP